MHFDHGNESIPDDFLTEKKSLCEERAHCTDARCAKLHSLAEVCWFNPDFRVNVCPDEDQCPHKFSCSGFHADRHASQRNAAMNNQVGLSEEILFVERTCTELAKRQAEALPGIFAWLRHQVVSKMPGSDLSSNPQSKGSAAHAVQAHNQKLVESTPPPNGLCFAPRGLQVITNSAKCREHFSISLLAFFIAKSQPLNQFTLLLFILLRLSMNVTADFGGSA